MRERAGTQDIFTIMLDFMEKNGDISKAAPGSQGRLDNLHKWLELSNLLDKARGEHRALSKWRKTWSDFKNNTKRKVNKIKRQGGEGPELTEAEKKLLKLLKKQHTSKRTSESDDDDEFLFKEKMEPNFSHRTPSPHPQYFCTVEGKSRRRQSRTSSLTSESSSSQHPSEKRKKHSNDDVKDITDRYFEFENERERLAHEREMARIKQNDQIISLFGRMVNVLESLSPSIQRYLDRNDTEAG